MSAIKTTPLEQEHIKLGGKMVEFAGWRMPIQYEGIRQEHDTVRNAVGLFDVSHMGEILVTGPLAVKTLQWTTTNDVSGLQDGQAHYSLFPNTEGGIVDDLIVYCLKKDSEYLVCVNASNTDKDFAFLQEHNQGANLTNVSSQWGQIAVQGPHAMKLLERVLGAEIKNLPNFHHQKFQFQGTEVIFARTGYTGEAGGEIFVPHAHTVALWQTLLEQGADLGVKPCGLGARDTLRTEMKYTLYGHEIDDQTNPYEAGLGWVVKPSAKDFIGKNRVLAAKEHGLKQKLIGFELIDAGIPRQGYKLFSIEQQEAGIVTSGTLSPTLNRAIGIGYLEKSLCAEGTEFYVEIRNRKIKAKVVKTPFITPKS